MQVQSQTVQPSLEQRTAKSENVQAKKPQINTQQTEGHQKSEKSTEQTSAYAKVLSRIENIEGDPALKEKAVNIFSNAIERRLKEVTDQERKQILNLDTVKELEIEKVEDFAPKIKEGLLNDEKKEETLALLKSPKFMEFMQDKADAKTYSPKQQQAEVAKEVENKPESAVMQKIKTTRVANTIKAANTPAPTRQTVA